MGKISICITISFILFSCAPKRVFYTESLHNKSNWTNTDLSKIQFFVSEDIVLWRDAGDIRSQVVNGKIKRINGRDIEEIIIQRGTPGQFLFSPKRDHFAIGFDATDDNKFLVFGPSPKTNGRFVLLAKEWNRQEGIVTYGGETFRTPAQSAFSYLLVELDNKARTKVSKNVEKGRKIN